MVYTVLNNNYIFIRTQEIKKYGTSSSNFNKIKYLSLLCN